MSHSSTSARLIDDPVVRCGELKAPGGVSFAITPSTASAGHALFADYRPSYRPEPAALPWERIVPFLAAHLRDA